MKDSPYFEQVRLLLRVLPHVAAESCFALKGGTAINLFVHDMPRLSVDIDLTYVLIEDREVSLTHISEAMERTAAGIEHGIPGSHVEKRLLQGTQQVFKLWVRYNGVQIKIEPNTVLRGTVYPAVKRDLCEEAQNLFELAVSDVPVLATPDLYGGKFCAALDRQHPRDFYDVKHLLDTTGIDDDTRKAFVIYLASSDRPMHELLDPKHKDIRQAYENELSGMTREPFSLEDLIATREQLITILRTNLTDADRAFLLSMKAGEPDWGLMDLPNIEQLPALRWKLLNVQRMTPKKRAAARVKLEQVLAR